MSAIGRWCAYGAAALAIVTLATWNRDDGRAGAEPPSSTSVAMDGAQLFQARGCAACHDGPDTTAVMINFPSLAEAPVWAGERRPGLTAEQYVAESIHSPTAFISPEFRPGGATHGMPDLHLSEAEIEAVVQYLLGEG